METCQHHALVELYPTTSVSEMQRMEFTVYCSEQLILQCTIYCTAEMNRLFKPTGQHVKDNISAIIQDFSVLRL